MPLWRDIWPGASIRLGLPNGATPLGADGLVPRQYLRGAAGGQPVVITANFTALPDQFVLADTAGGSFTLKLPANPPSLSRVVIGCLGASWLTNSLLVDGNGHLIEGEPVWDFDTPVDFYPLYRNGAWHFIF